MKGDPPFTRHQVALESLTPAIAGLGDNLRKAKILWREPSRKLLSNGRFLWLLLEPKAGFRVAVRLVHEEHGWKDGPCVRARSSGISVSLRGRLGRYRITATFERDDPLSLHAVVTLKPDFPVQLADRGRELFLLNEELQPLEEGLLFTTQTKASAGQAFVAAGDATLFYFQNLGTLARYTSLAGGSLIGSVGVDWPALGLELPPGERPLPKGEEVVISDLFLRIRPGGGASEAERALEFVDSLAHVCRQIAPSPGPWFDWAAAAERTLKALRNNGACMRKIRGRSYLNAYVGSEDKPPESMVQGAVYVPLVEYEQWAEKSHPLARQLAGNLICFCIDDLGTVARWLPGEKFRKQEPSEEEQQDKMDSWYLLHTLMNLGRLAELGKEPEKKLFLGSLDYVIHVANHFKHDWPVFYHRKTLRVFKKEKEDGKGGEQDAAGLYAHVMMQAWEVTRDRRYLAEAEAAAAKLEGLGFGVLYQTNNTTFTAVALAWLWKETGNVLYKDLSFVCMASILSHLWIWEPARPGHSWRTFMGLPWRTFMGLPPLHDAPYIAAYEEAEIFATSRAYLEIMGGDAPPALVELWTEYGKHLLGRARFYLPAELPPESICESPKEGVLKPELPIPVEDLYPSQESAGQVGQQVYGAALPLILTTRSYHRWKQLPFMLWCEAPIASAEFKLENKKKKRGELCFSIAASSCHRYALRIVPGRRGSKFRFVVRRQEQGKRQAKLRPTLTPEGHHAFDAAGAATIAIEWLPL